MQERYLTTVDLGSEKIGLCVARVIGKNINIIYYKESPSYGVRHSCVYNPAKAAEALRSALDDAERELDINILQVVVGLPRYSVSQEIASARLDCDDSVCISPSDTGLVKNEALATYPIKDPGTETIYGAITQSFSTDELLNASEDDVIGTTSRFLDGNFKIFIGPKKAVSNIDTMLQMADVSCAGKMFLPDATARAILSESEMDNGVALFEIGAGVSSLTIYQGNIMRHYCSIPFAGKSITSDIKYECGFQQSLAENIKLAWGACIPEKLQNLSEKILQINDDDHGTYEHLSVKYLSEIISARAREIIEALAYNIHDSGFGRRLRCGIVLTGGCSELTNMASYVHDLTGFNVRVGYPRSTFVETGECSEAESPQAAASIGMLLQAAASLPDLDCLESAPVIRPERKKDIQGAVKVQPENENSAGTGEEENQDGPAGIFRPEDLKQNLFTEYGALEKEGVTGQLFDQEELETKKEAAPKQKKARKTIHWDTPFRSVGVMIGNLFDNIEE